MLMGGYSRKKLKRVESKRRKRVVAWRVELQSRRKIAGVISLMVQWELQSAVLSLGRLYGKKGDPAAMQIEQ
jgi:hypothetical protein